MSAYKIRIKKKKLSKKRTKKEKAKYRAWAYLTYQLRKAKDAPNVWTVGVNFGGEVGKDAAEFDFLTKT